MRDITLEDTFQQQFTTRAFGTGIPGTLGGTPVLSVKESGNATPITAGVSVSVDAASVTGLNEATIVATAANGYEALKTYALYISTGTVGGVSVVGEVVGEFTIGASAAAVDLANGTDGLSALKTLIDAITVAVITNATGADVASDVVAMKAETVLIVADTNELQVDWTNGGRLDLLLDAIKAITDAQAATGTGLTAIPWNSAWDAEVQSEVNDALVVLGLDHLVAVAVVGADVIDNSLMAKLAGSGATADWDTFVNTTDSLQAIRDRGDSAWITGGGGGITDILNVMPIIPVIDLANTATVRIALQLINSLDDLPSTAEITPGTISIDRKAIGGTSWSSVVSDAAMSEAAGLVYFDEVFDSGTGYAAGDSIRITFKSQKITVAANDYEITDATGVMYQTFIREAMRGTNGANTTTPPTVGAIADQVWDEAQADHVAAGSMGLVASEAAYDGPRGPGVYLNDAAANTNTVNGTDGIIGNPVSTIAAAKTIADSLSYDRIYLVNDSVITLVATMVDYEFVGLGERIGNVVNLGSQDVSGSAFYNLTIEGTQGGSGRIYAEDCALQDPGAGSTTLHIVAFRCGNVDDITLDASQDNEFVDCYSLVAGTSAPIFRASGASGTIQFRRHAGGVDIRDLSASHNVTIELEQGQVIFHSSNNVNATVALRGIGSKTDNTAGMADLDETAFINMPKINAEADAALSDYDGPTKTEMDDAHALLATPAQVLAQVNAGWTTQMADSVAADGAIATRQQAMYEILQFLTEFDWVGTTLTIRKVDGTTQLMVFTADDATNPTTITRTT